MEKFIRDIFQSCSEENFVAALEADGCNAATAAEAFALCCEGKFEEAAVHAHMGGWM